jgi:hypothetical protein
MFLMISAKKPFVITRNKVIMDYARVYCDTPEKLAETLPSAGREEMAVQMVNLFRPAFKPHGRGNNGNEQGVRPGSFRRGEAARVCRGAVALPLGGPRVERKTRRKKAHHRVVVDRQVWEQLARGRGEEANFSALVSRLLESCVAGASMAASRPGPKVSVDITVDEALWSEAARVARSRGLAVSHVLRELLREHLQESRRRRPS